MPTDTAGLPFLQALADPQRWRLLQELGRSDRRVHELTDLLGQPQNLVSYHLRQLREAGLVTARRSSADRRDTYYRAELDRIAVGLAEAGSALQPGLRLVAAPPIAPQPTGRRPRVLFLCTGNSARSQLAEALAQHRSGGTVDARSAGSRPKVLHPNAVRVLASRGIDIGDRSAKDLRRFTRSRFDAVVTLCDRVREVCPELPHHPAQIHWSIADPALEGDTDEATYPAFERTADELEWRVDHLLAQLADLGDDRRRDRPHHKETRHA